MGGGKSAPASRKRVRVPEVAAVLLVLAGQICACGSESPDVDHGAFGHGHLIPEAIVAVSGTSSGSSGLATYYTTSALLQLCVQPADGGVKTLDSLRQHLLDRYQPTRDGRTLWSILSNSTTLLSPSHQNRLVENITWPHAREEMKSTPTVCLEGRSPESPCCCKARGSWDVHAKFRSHDDAVQLLEVLRDAQDSDQVCIALRSGEVTGSTDNEERSQAAEVPSGTNGGSPGQREAAPKEASSRRHGRSRKLKPFYIILGFAAVFAAAIGAACTATATQLMWQRFVWGPLRRRYAALQVVRIETDVQRQAARLRALYGRLSGSSGRRDPLNETDESISGEDEEGGGTEMLELAEEGDQGASRHLLKGRGRGPPLPLSDHGGDKEQ